MTQFFAPAHYGGVFRFYDTQCGDCDYTHESLINVPHGEDVPREVEQDCPACEARTAHRRLVSAPAPYLGEKILNPQVRGGKFDTMGYEQGPPLPDLPGAEAHNERLSTALNELPDGPTKRLNRSTGKVEKTELGHARAEVIRSFRNDAPSDADYSAMFEKPEYKEAEAARARVHKRNAEKKKRAAALARGENVNFRRDRCAGDPSMSA